MKSQAVDLHPQPVEEIWSTALLLSFIVAIVFMFGSMPAKTGSPAALSSNNEASMPAADDKIIFINDIKMAAVD